MPEHKSVYTYIYIYITKKIGLGKFLHHSKDTEVPKSLAEKVTGKVLENS